jgi:hypothetical protein
MKCNKNLLPLLGFLLIAFSSHAQLWSGILQPTSGSGSCSFGQISSAGQCAVDWTAAGIPGGIPTAWTQSGSTISAGSGDQSSAIQSALNSCSGSHYVQLGTGTFQINNGLQIKNNCFLNGNGPQKTVINCLASSGSCIRMGTVNDDPYKNGTCTITAGNTAGSTSITVSAKGLDGNACAVGVGGYLVISELNDKVYVSGAAPQNPGGCNYCDVLWGGTRLREQIVEMESVSGSGPYTVTISPALYTNYGVASGTAPAYATPFGALNGGTPDCKYCGVQNLQLVSNGTGLASGMSDINMTECAYCWIFNVEANYTDGDFVDADYCYRCEIRNSYFFNAYGHGAGGTDNFVGFMQETTASLMINNIIERGHVDIEVDLGAAGNVIAYNYTTGAVDAVATNVNELDYNQHGAYPQFNLWEGNVGTNFQPDSWHGNEGYNTAFRNWWTGSTLVATYPQQTMTGGSCSGGTCTINWASGMSNFYAGTYITIMGTNQTSCGTGSLATPVTGVVWQLTGNAGSKSSTFSGSCASSWTGGFAFTVDLSKYPTPITHTGIGALSWTSTYYTYQGMWGVTIPAFSTGNNLVGNVLGSDQQTATVGAANMYNGGAGACSSCTRVNTSRPYSGLGYTSTYNYDTSGDGSGSVWASFPGGPSGANGYWSTQGFSTACYHENFDSASGSTLTDVNCSPGTNLPASFFLSAKPSWWVSAFGAAPPWPAVGPDVSGGPDHATEGHANYNPAELCYNGLSRDSTGAKEFDATVCYGTAQPPPPAPQNLQLVVH